MPPPPTLPTAARPTATTIADETGDEPEPSGEPSAPPSVMLEPLRLELHWCLRTSLSLTPQMHQL